MFKLRALFVTLAAALLTGCTLGPWGVYGGIYYAPVLDPGWDTLTPVPTLYATQEHAPTATPAPMGDCWVDTGGSGNLNVRSGPDLRYDVVTTLANGTRFEAIGGAGNWVRIADPAGWVSDAYVRCAD